MAGTPSLLSDIKHDERALSEARVQPFLSLFMNADAVSLVVRVIGREP